MSVSTFHSQNISPTTCEISGTPTVMSAPTVYTVTASNTAGIASTAITIIVEGLWVHEAYLKASNAEAGDMFAASVSISSDTIAVGAQLEGSGQTTITNGQNSSSDNSVIAAGAVYVFHRIGSDWAQEAYLKAPNAETGDQFGHNLSITSDTIAVAAGYEDSNQTTITNGNPIIDNNLATNGAGAVYVFKRIGSNWAHEAYLKAPNAEAWDVFGSSISVDSDTIAVGAYGEDSKQTISNGPTVLPDTTWAQDSGAVYVFKRTGSTWVHEAYLKAPNADVNDFFGLSVSVSSDTIAVGAIREASNQTTITNGATASSNNSVSGSGAVYVFKRTGTNWEQEAYLKASNAEAWDQFGKSVSISSDTIAVGAVSEDSNQTTITNGATASLNNSASDSGSVYVFKRTGTNWEQEAYLKAPNAEANDLFGLSVSVSSDTIVAGAPYEASSQATITNGATASSDNSASGSGAVYVFKRTGKNWAHEAYLKAPNADANDSFGTTISVSSDTIAVGSTSEASNQTTITNGATASSDNSAGGAGAVYVFRKQ